MSLYFVEIRGHNKERFELFKSHLVKDGPQKNGNFLEKRMRAQLGERCDVNNYFLKILLRSYIFVLTTE